MTIPETQLEKWSHRGADVTAQNTHGSIRAALTGPWQLQGKNADVFLQGSYKNFTNVRADSDVDVVVMLTDSFHRDISALPADQRALYDSQHHDAIYTWDQFRTDVLAALRDYYGPQSVTEGNKAIKLARTSNRLAADIVVATEFRRYISYRGVNAEKFVEGIWFRNRADGRPIVNYPKPHFDNGANKNSTVRTGGQFKPVVRVFKNARACLEDRGLIAAGLAPSYFIQCLLYNVPDARYSSSLQQTYLDIVSWLRTAPLDSFLCQNGQTALFGQTPEQWSQASAKTLINGFSKLWTSWGT